MLGLMPTAQDRGDGRFVRQAFSHDRRANAASCHVDFRPHSQPLTPIFPGELLLCLFHRRVTGFSTVSAEDDIFDMAGGAAHSLIFIVAQPPLLLSAPLILVADR